STTFIANWQEVSPHRSEVLIEDIDIFKAFLVVSERPNGLNQIRIMRWDGTEDFYLPFDNETYTAYTGTNVEFGTVLLRYPYTALDTPCSTIDFNQVTTEKPVRTG